MEIVSKQEIRAARAKSNSPGLKAEHPVFWAGNMLLGIPDNTPAAPGDQAVEQPEPDQEPGKMAEPNPAAAPKPDKAGDQAADKPPVAGEAADKKAEQEAEKAGGGGELDG